jgi:hypothetical protein
VVQCVHGLGCRSLVQWAVTHWHALAAGRYAKDHACSVQYQPRPLCGWYQVPERPPSPSLCTCLVIGSTQSPRSQP